MEGQIIRLRDIRASDLDVYRRWLMPGHEWQELDGPYYPKMTPNEVTETIKAVEAHIVAANWPSVRTRLVVAERESDALIGLVTRYWISQETNWAALGLVIYDPANWGRGIGYEALGLWSDYQFNHEPDWVRLDLRTWSGNVGMIRLAAKLGYTQEACFRKARIVNGQFYDGLGFGILRDEWQARFPAGFQASLIE